MKKDLPSVFANAIDKQFDNVQEVFHVQENRSIKPKITKKVSVDRKISRIFSSPNHVYKSRVLITTDNGVSEEYIVGRTNGILLTIDGKRIMIHEILDLEEM